MVTAHRRFVLQRDTDHTGVSGEGVVAEGVLFSNGVVALQWTSEFPTSVVFHQRGMESVEAVHGHGGATRIVWLDEEREAYGQVPALLVSDLRMAMADVGLVLTVFYQVGVGIDPRADEAADRVHSACEAARRGQT